MADTPPLTPREYDPWRLATPLQLLTLLERLGVSMSDVARSLRVPRSSISMWRHGTRIFPPKHVGALHALTRSTFDQAADLTRKAESLAPTPELREAIRAEFGALWVRWKSDVLLEAGTYRRAMLRQYEALGTLVHQEHFSAEDPETARVMAENLARYVEMIRTLEPERPSPEEELIARLTAAHDAAHDAAYPTQGEETPHTP